ncbi:hypothetical protein HY450_01050 [Candidatus Pacearchaeota archaeon]|nr:hypothetical protein [Candidatus Pacearchaeota archaeon]
MHVEEFRKCLYGIHERVISVMSPVVDVSVVPAEIVVRPLLVRYMFGINKCSEAKIFVRKNKDDFYEGRDIDEIGIAHETGHYFHSQNAGMVKNLEEITENERTKKINRVINYHELVAEFFMCCYFDVDSEGYLFSRVPEQERDELYSQIQESYFSIPSIEERKRIIKLLIHNSYDQAKRMFRKNGELERFREIVFEK